MLKKISIFCFLLSLGWSVEQAKINVVTDLPSAKIFINGDLAGYDTVQNYNVDPGTHYVAVWYRNKQIFGETYQLSSGEVKTIPTSHFVSFKTNVANRGAVDMEAERIKETRGNFGIGIQAASSVGGLSLKKWFTERWGAEIYGIISGDNNESRSTGGMKIFFWLADKVVFDAPFSGYLFAGLGGENYANRIDSEYNVRRTLSHGGFGVEYSPFGVNGIFLSLELGLERQVRDFNSTSRKDETLTIPYYAGGFHFYF